MISNDPATHWAPHLVVSVTDYGFTCLPPILSTYAGEVCGEVRVYESSVASKAHVWLMVRYRNPLNKTALEANLLESAVHLTTDNAWHLAEQLITLVLGHYQCVEPPGDAAFDVVDRRYYEEDEDPTDVPAAFETGAPVVTRPPEVTS